MTNSNSDSLQSAIDTYRYHVTKRLTYIDKCAVDHLELTAMDELAVLEIVEAHHATTVEECVKKVIQGESFGYDDNGVLNRTDDYTSIVQGVSSE